MVSADRKTEQAARMTTLQIQSIQPEHVRSVYSGKAKKCCCGCSGSYYYAAAHRAEASLDRGYAVGDDDVSERDVLRVLRTLQAAEAGGDAVEFDGDGHISVEVGKRLYMVQLANGFEVASPAAVCSECTRPMAPEECGDEFPAERVCATCATSVGGAL